MRARIIELRRTLTGQGSDAGPVTIGWHLEQEGLPEPSTSTIRRILHDAGLVTPEPRKRPRSSWIRFEAAQPNETWQSDFTHWRLADGSDVEILNWLDDHARYLLSCTAHAPVTGEIVVAAFLTATAEHGVPASTLTDNGRVFTARFGGGRNAFEYVLPLLGVRQKNGAPGHPQTQGKIERFHQTLKRWLRQQPAAATLADLRSSSSRPAASTSRSAGSRCPTHRRPPSRPLRRSLIPWPIGESGWTPGCCSLAVVQALSNSPSATVSARGWR